MKAGRWRLNLWTWIKYVSIFLFVWISDLLIIEFTEDIDWHTCELWLKIFIAHKNFGSGTKQCVPVWVLWNFFNILNFCVFVGMIFGDSLDMHMAALAAFAKPWHRPKLWTNFFFSGPISETWPDDYGKRLQWKCGDGWSATKLTSAGSWRTVDSGAGFANDPKVASGFRRYVVEEYYVESKLERLLIILAAPASRVVIASLNLVVGQYGDPGWRNRTYLSRKPWTQTSIRSFPDVAVTMISPGSMAK